MSWWNAGRRHLPRAGWAADQHSEDLIKDNAVWAAGYVIGMPTWSCACERGAVSAFFFGKAPVMWWIILFVIGVGAVFLGFLRFRTTAGERRRFARWSDLHERGKLMTAQLARLREVEVGNEGAGRRQVVRSRTAGRGRWAWRRRAPAKPGTGSGVAD
jgi:hypothetical protein